MKVLILRPQDICYGIVDTFAVRFGQALLQAGIEVDWFDLKTQPLDSLACLDGAEYMAVIDFYSGLLSLRDADGGYFWDSLNVQVFQICVDFPVYIMEKMDAKLQRYFVLCMDRHYCGVVRECLPHIADTYFFPMAGQEGNGKIPWEQRMHDLVFVGTYSDYRNWLLELNQADEGIRQLGYAYFSNMRSHVQMDQKQAFELTLSQFQIHLSTQEFYQWLKMVGGIARSAAFYQREQVIRTLLEQGIQVTVFGDSWKTAPFADRENLTILGQLDEAEYISVMEHAKISLNIMYCNQAGYSERYAYTMLNGAVCVSDVSEYISDEFTDGKEIVFYHLDQLDELPGKIRWLLQHPQEASKIADAAYQKARVQHTWKERAERFLQILRNCK